MEQKKYPYVKGLLIVSFLLVHFVITYFYVAPDEFNVNGLKQLSGNYIKPVFHQGWSLFAPELPEYNVDVAYRTDSTGQWHEFSACYLRNHHKFRVTHHGRISIGISNVARGAVWEISGIRERQEDRILLKELVRKIAGINEGGSIEIRLSAKSVKTGITKHFEY